MLILLASLCFLFGEALSEGFGMCPQISDTREVKLEKFIGKWYIIASQDSPVTGQRCGAIDFMKHPKNPHVLNMTISYFHYTANKIITDPSRELVPRKPGQRIYEYKSEFGLWSVDFQYWIASTDYDSWALLYSCAKSSLMYRVSGFFLVRERGEKCLTNEQKHVIKKKMESVPEWELNSFIWQDQSNCD